MVEKSSGEKIKTLTSDNGGEYTSKEFEDYLKKNVGGNCMSNVIRFETA